MPSSAWCASATPARVNPRRCATTAFGRRTAVVETDGTTSTETRYLWCGERVCQARDGADTVTRRYYDEGELAVGATGDVATFYAEDHLGSIRDLRMGDGQVQASYDYDPYGAPTRTDETGGVHADYRYAGLVQHAPSGLYLAHYRAYSPQNGRWITRDPIFEAGGVNLYAYANNSPILLIDRDGLNPAFVIFAGLEAGGAIGDFWNNYHDMREAGWKGADKYFHCKANCEASRRGPTGEATSCKISDTREWWDQNVKGYPSSDSAADQMANQFGRNHSSRNSGASCAQICAPYRPTGLPEKY